MHQMAVRSAGVGSLQGIETGYSGRVWWPSDKVGDQKNGTHSIGTLWTFGLLKIKKVNDVWKDLDKMQKKLNLSLLSLTV
jgi:hypothetical protein